LSGFVHPPPLTVFVAVAVVRRLRATRRVVRVAPEVLPSGLLDADNSLESRCNRYFLDLPLSFFQVTVFG
jgi:hypothetical protein